MTPSPSATAAELDDAPAPDVAVAAAALERAVETAWQLLRAAAEIASQSTGGPVRIDVDPRRWADGAETNAQAIGRVLLNASVEAERLVAIGQSARATRPAPPVLAPFVVDGVRPEPIVVAPVWDPVEIEEIDEIPPPPPPPPPPVVATPMAVPAPPPPPPATAIAAVVAAPVRPTPTLVPNQAVLTGPPAPVRPITLPEGLARWRVRTHTVLTWTVGIAVLTLLFVAYQLWGTGLSEARAQNTLGSDFKAALTHSGANTAQVSSKLIVVPPPKHLPGDAVGRIQIPKIGVDKFVVEGTERDDLEKGPGHYIGSSQPGHPGNVAIAGHRTTYGAPFNRLDELDVGSDIYLTTVEGRFLYKVSEQPFPVSPYNNSVVQDYGDNRLTLTTCNPKYSAVQRLIVVAKFVGKNPLTREVRAKVNPATGAHDNTGTPVAAAARASHVETGASDGWGGSAPLVLFWLAVVIGLGLAYRPLRKHWPVLAVYAVIIPTWVCVLFLFFEQLNRFLPANV